MCLKVFLNKKPYITFTILCSTEKKPTKLNKDSNTQDCTKQWSIVKTMEIETNMMDKAIIMISSVLLEWDYFSPWKQTKAVMTKLAVNNNLQ